MSEISIARENKVSPLNAVRNQRMNVVAHPLRIEVTGTPEEKIRQAFAALNESRRVHIVPFSVGAVERRMSDDAHRYNIVGADGDLYFDQRTLTHTPRSSKQRDGISVSEQSMATFPTRRVQMDLYWDSWNGGAYVYTDYKEKYIVRPNGKIRINRKEERHAYVVTGREISNREEFNDRKRYRKVEER